MFSSNFYSCPLLLLAVTNLGFGAKFCRRGIKGDEIKVFHIQFAMEQSSLSPKSRGSLPDRFW